MLALQRSESSKCFTMRHRASWPSGEDADVEPPLMHSAFAPTRYSRASTRPPYWQLLSVPLGGVYKPEDTAGRPDRFKIVGNAASCTTP